VRNITVLQFLVTIVFLFSAINPAYCNDNNRIYSFTITPLFGFVYGQSHEFVYPTNTMGEFLSELLWDMKPVFYGGLKLDFGRTDIMSRLGFFSSVSFKIGFPGDSGLIENRDWMSVQNADLTHFSSHTNRTNEFFWLDVAVGLSVPVQSFFYLKPFISGSWMYFSFSGRDGYGTYAREKAIGSNTFFPIEQNPIHYSFEGMEVIRYRQDWFLAGIGLSLGKEVLSRFSFDISCQISPFTYCVAEDQHLTRQITFYDFTGWGFFVEPKSRFSFKWNQFLFSLEYAYRYIGKTRGKTYIGIGDHNVVFESTNASGAGLAVFYFQLLFGVKI
jgi:outer membrane protease